MQFLDRAGANVGDIDRAIFRHCQAVWLTTQAAQKLLLTIRINACHSTTPVRDPECPITLGKNRFWAYEIMSDIGQVAEFKSELFHGNSIVAHSRPFLR